MTTAMPSFTDNVRRIVQSIPVGKVLDYKTVAYCAGSPNGQRNVGKALGPPGNTDGWHRVVRKSGELASPESDAQHKLLVQDGVKFEGDRVADMSAHLWECGDFEAS